MKPKHKSIIVKLNEMEIRMGAHYGVIRQIEAITKGKSGARGPGKSLEWQVHIEGCLAELAFSKWMNLHWQITPRMYDGDVGLYEVRSSPVHSNRLIIRDRDPKDRTFVFITGSNGVYYIRGYMDSPGLHVSDEYRQAYNGRESAYFIPNHLLRDPRLLKKQ